ncbi:YetF domain-containing protein [Paenibacillus baekrokdamisoli]
MRFMGKREIGKLSVLDLVISVMIAEIAVIVIEDTKRPLMDGLLPMILLMGIQIGLAFLTLKNRKLRLWFDGKPTVIIERGKINRDAMNKQRYNLDDLMVQLRENQVSTVADVEFAFLETTGKLSVIQKEKPQSSSSQQQSSATSASGNGSQQPPSITKLAKPFPKNFRFESLPVPLIMDGKVVSDNLESLGKDRFWLNNQLRQKGITDLKQVFLCTLDHKGKLFIDSRRTPRQ